MKNISAPRYKPLFQAMLACGILALPAASYTQPKGPVQVVKPPIALAYIDVATNGSDMPGGNMMAGMAQGNESGGLFGALGGLAKGALGGATDRGNTFGNTR